MSSSTGFVLWFTGLSGAGKSTLAANIAPLLRERDTRVEVLDGDEIRAHLSQRLGFTKDDRDMNVRRIGFVATLLARNGCAAITAAISPYEAIRQECRAQAERSDTRFVEVWVDAPLEIVEQRDTKGLYAKARAGLIKHFTGVSDPYEPPRSPEVVVRTGEETVEQSVTKVLDYLVSEGLVHAQANAG